MTTKLKVAAYDADGIWGVGDTEDQARAEALGYLRELFEDPDDDVIANTNAGLRFAPIDAALLAEVHDAGGSAGTGAGYEFFTIEHGVLVSCDEAFATTAAARALLFEVVP